MHWGFIGMFLGLGQFLGFWWDLDGIYLDFMGITLGDAGPFLGFMWD